MDEGYQGIIDTALFELTNRAEKQLQKTDPGYEARLKAHVQNEYTLNGILDELGPCDRATVEAYLREERSLGYDQDKHAYIQGAKDFVRLMKELGAL